MKALILVSLAISLVGCSSLMFDQEKFDKCMQNQEIADNITVKVRTAAGKWSKKSKQDHAAAANYMNEENVLHEYCTSVAER